MADRDLVTLFPDAMCPLYLEPSAQALARYGEKIPTFFGMAVYNNPIGIEVELEDWKGVWSDRFYWHAVEDGSLKDHGMELVSSPLSGRCIDYAIHELSLILEQNSPKFSHRTSVHVHCNVSKYSRNQLITLMALYACVEEMLFSFVDGKRRGNSFAYRLVGTPAEVIFYPSNKEGQPTTKYCAFNIAPVPKQMTVEFRHLEGTQDFKKLRRWLQLVAKLVGRVLKLPKKTCVPDFLDALEKDLVVENYILPIWGNTGKALFRREAMQRSVNIGKLWATTLLLNEES